MSAFSIITLVLILCVIGFAISTDLKFDASYQDYQCIPGQTYMQDCNICFCGQDGKSELCTYKLCPVNNELIRPGNLQFKCIPGELFRYDCYECRCYDGVNAFCNFAFCNTKNNAKSYCKDTDSKMNDCNLCKCINGEWACTKKYCVPDVDIFEYKNCERGSSLRRGCNICHCVPEIGYACNKEECAPDQPIDLIQDKNCNEKEVYKLGCSVCKCIPGLGYVCDRQDCPEAVFVNRHL